MGSTLASLLPLMIGSALAPVWIIVVLLLLRGKGGLTTAIAFVAGLTTVRLVQGILFGLVFGNQSSDGGDSDSNSIVSILLIVIAILMLTTAGRLLLKGDDPDSPPPKWMSKIEGITPITAFGIAAAWLLVGAKYWVFTLSAIGILSDADLAKSENILLFLIYVFGCQILLIAPVALFAARPEQSAVTLERAGAWLEKHNRIIVIAVSVVFGIYFAGKGISGLI